jgi:tetratricopeptide (TPR) repeat protein/glycosyltransferase involved in cell wall biosynthesis
MENFITENYQSAIYHFEQKEFQKAETILLKLLSEDPDDFNILNFLGIIKLNCREFQDAVQYFQKVLTIYPSHTTALYNLGLSYQSSGDYDKAYESYETLLELDPDHIDGLNNLGIIHLGKNELEKAGQFFLHVLKLQPENKEASINLANLKLKKEEYDAAIELYKKVIDFNSSKPDYIFNLGTAYLKKRNYDEALKYFDYTLKLQPNHFGALNNIGIILTKKNEYEKAETLYQTILNYYPDNTAAKYNLAQCFEQSSKLDKAEKAYHSLLEAEPDNNAVLLNLGTINEKLSKENSSNAYYDKVAPGDFDKLAVFTNLGISRMQQGRIDDAIELWKKALKIKPDSPDVNYNLGHAYLLKGNFKEGWKGYEWRKKRKVFVERKFPEPELIRQDVNGKTVLVYDEQGLGDAIQFIRYLKLLKEKGARIIFEYDKKLSQIFKDISWADVHVPREDYFRLNLDFDYHVSLLSLPLYFQTNINNIPSQIPYIFAGNSASEKLAPIFKKNKKFNVGIVWAGNPNNSNDQNRSCNLSEFASLCSVEGVQLISLQKGKGVEQLEKSGLPVLNLEKLGINSFAHIAAIIENLDLVISVDTSIAHLTGAMGKPVWTVLPFLPDWRWMLDRDDSPWYPSMRLFRQKTAGDWSGVFEEVKRELEKLKSNKQVKPEESFGHQKLDGSDRGGSNLRAYNIKDKILTSKVFEPLYLALSSGDNFGWGVCSKYLRKELPKFINIKNLDEDFSSKKRINGALFTALVDVDLNPLFQARGDKNFGYTFFENELTKTSKINASKYDKIYTGSSWCKNKMIESGIFNSDVLLQGIDPELFFPVDDKENKNSFVIFSGGKLELRKGQDLVIKAVKILQDKYKDIILVNAWYNFWENTALSLHDSKFIKFEFKGRTWEEKINNLLRINGLDANRIITLPVIPHSRFREIYRQTDIGLFPNRCEGGTNLVLMEYMACGKPAVVSFTSGHMDIVNEDNSILLSDLDPFKLSNNQNELTADWEEAKIDEIISSIEYAYNNRDLLRRLGVKAGEDMKNFTWTNTAGYLAGSINLNLKEFKANGNY